MADAQTATQAPKVTRREDYREPDWRVPEIAMDFDLDPAATRVRTTLRVERNGTHDRPLRLDGDGLTALGVKVDGAQVSDWSMDGASLVVPLTGAAHEIETEVEIAPERNTQLQGLYASGGILCTQCEAEGFRRITFFPDRPDVLSKYKVKLTADKVRFPVLLANGDPIAQGDLEGGRHWAEWHDPFPKPSYLFALVAGDLVANRGTFITMSGREVQLGIWVRAPDLPKTDHALHALKLSMAWDEKVYGREYDLDVFNIVAVDDFNFGAMENKGLNVFNSRYILADPDTATDYDYDAIAAVVAHEYFHNWSGNRVTCRDWFQLSLKEGFTVFRDQSFSADQGSAAVKRIEDVRGLRASQFPEDAGPLAHPVRPDEYMEISNFYTATIYNKGAEVIRMMATILGAKKFRAATDLYFDRFDGTAATCEDFVQCMEQGGEVDLTRFRRWYTQAGTPRVSATLAQEGGRARLQLRQMVPPTPGQPVKEPMVLPLKLKLFGAISGKAVSDEQLVLLEDETHEMVFENLAEQPVLSINRGFSAPVVVETNRTAKDLAFLSAHGNAWFYANLGSIFDRNSDPPLVLLGAFLKVALILAPLLIVSGLSRHVPVNHESEHPIRALYFGWLIASVFGLIVFGTWFNHYALPVMLPACLCCAGFLGSHPTGRRIVAPLLLLAAGLGGEYTVWSASWHRGNATQLETLAETIGHGPGCMYVYSGNTSLYSHTGRCTLSPWVYPSHLSRERENGAVGVDQLAEIGRIFAKRPEVVVMGPAFSGERAESRALTITRLREGKYALRGRYPLGKSLLEVYAAPGSTAGVAPPRLAARSPS